MAGHHHRDLNVRRIQAQIVNQSFGEPFNRKLGCGVGRMRHGRAKGCPKPVDTTRVHNMTFITLEQHR